MCIDCNGMVILPECGDASDHISHLIQNVVLIARKSKQLKVATIIMVYLNAHVLTESPVHVQPLFTCNSPRHCPAPACLTQVLDFVGRKLKAVN